MIHATDRRHWRPYNVVFLDAHILEYEIVAADTAWNSCKPLSL